jgi:hypothetical protein
MARKVLFLPEILVRPKQREEVTFLKSPRCTSGELGRHSLFGRIAEALQLLKLLTLHSPTFFLSQSPTHCQHLFFDPFLRNASPGVTCTVRFSSFATLLRCSNCLLTGFHHVVSNSAQWLYQRAAGRDESLQRYFDYSWQ